MLIWTLLGFHFMLNIGSYSINVIAFHNIYLFFIFVIYTSVTGCDMEGSQRKFLNGKNGIIFLYQLNYLNSRFFPPYSVLKSIMIIRTARIIQIKPEAYFGSIMNNKLRFFIFLEWNELVFSFVRNEIKCLF